ncbi:MAG: GspH/FimT family pseudopilin [Pseudomonadota bacterium]
MNSKNQGFTIIELVITLALAAVVAGLAAPSVVNMIRENAVVAINNQIVADIQFTRSEAIKRNIPVTICAANADQDACIVSNDWSNGWIAFAETITVNGAVDAGEPIVRVNEGASSDTMTIRTSTAGNIVGHVAFQGNGFPVIPPAGTLPNTNFLVCEDNNTTYSRSIRINQSGRVESAGQATGCS